MKNIGIWLDSRKAVIVRLEGEKEALDFVNSEIEDFNVTSYKSTGGPKESPIDSKYLERYKNQLHTFFKEIVVKIEDADAIVLFGPAQTNDKFYKVLRDSFPRISKKVAAVEKADSMTNNQVKAWVKKYFGAPM